MTTKLFTNARIFTPRDEGCPAVGKKQGDLISFPQGAILVENGIIKLLGDEKEVLEDTDFRKVQQEINCEGLCLIPGFIDPHTHMCFADRREKEFEMRIGGASYLDILKRGGGILSSVEAVRCSTVESLFRKTCKRVLSALSFGTTTLEIKSGYGLDVENELKMLDVINRVGRSTPLDIVPTFLGAHAVPKEFANNPDDFVSLVMEKMLPAVKKQGIARFCDVFCEKDVLSTEQGRRILQAALRHGLDVKIHADEVHDLGGAGLAAELKAVSADHLLAANVKNVAALAEAGTVAVLLPATAYSLRKPLARAREMIAAGVPVALATDCNPGSSYTESMPFVIGLAVLSMGMTPAEALTASTLNAAYAIGASDSAGSLEKGKLADFLLLDGRTPSMIPYHAGVSSVIAVFKRGECVFQDGFGEFSVTV